MTDLTWTQKAALYELSRNPGRPASWFHRTILDSLIKRGLVEESDTGVWLTRAGLNWIIRKG